MAELNELPEIPSSSVETPPAPVRRKSNFAGDVIKLVSGTTIAQIFGVIVVPILARIFSPEDFGVSQVFQSMLSIVAVITCMRYELAIVLPEDDEKAANVLALTALFSFVTSLISVPIMVFGGKPLSILLGAPEMAKYLWMFPLSMFFTGIFQALNYWNTRTRRFGRLSLARLSNNVVSVGAQLVAGVAAPPTPGGLIGGSFVGTAFSSLSLMFSVWKENGRLFLANVNRKTMREMLDRYKKFPLYSTWSALLNSISWQLPAFLLSPLFSPAVVGYYSLGNRVLRMPMNLIGAALAQAFLPRASDAAKDGKLRFVVEDTYKRLVAYSLFPLLVLSLVGRDLFIVFFGAEWAEAGLYTQILSLWTFFWFISSPLSNLFTVLERQEFSLKINLAIFLTRLASLLIGGWLKSPRLAFALFALSGVLTYGYLSVVIINISGVPWNRIWRILWTHFWPFLPVGVVLLGVQYVQHNSWPVTILAGVVVAGYVLFTITRDPVMLQTLGKGKLEKWVKKLPR